MIYALCRTIGFLRFERVLSGGHPTARPLGTPLMTTVGGDFLDDPDLFQDFDGEGDSLLESSMDASSDMDVIRVHISEWYPGVGVDNETNPVGQLLRLPVQVGS